MSDLAAILARPDSALTEVLLQDDARWWVAHTRSRNEKALADDLARFGLPHYLPLCKRVTRSRRTHRVSRSILPVFPGYLFFVGNADDRLRALSTQRIANTIPVADADRLVEQLRQVELALRSGEPMARSARVAEGERVRVLAGPMAGLIGVVVRWRSRLRIILNVDILGQSASVEVDADTVERLDE